MQNFLSKIEEMFEKQNVFIKSEFQKLSKRITNLKSRVTALEKDKKKRESAPPKPKIKNYESFSDNDYIQKDVLITDLKELTYQSPKGILSYRQDRRVNPKFFQNFGDIIKPRYFLECFIQ